MTVQQNYFRICIQAKFSIPQQNHFRVQFVNKNCATEN